MIRLPSLAVLALTAVFSALDVNAAFGHTRSQSSSRWRVDGDRLLVRVESTPLDVTRLGALSADAPLDETSLAEYAGSRFFARTDRGECTREDNPNAATAPRRPGFIVADLIFLCPPGALTQGPIEITGDLYFDVAPTHIHFVSLVDPRRGDGDGIIVDGHRKLVINPRPPDQGADGGAVFLEFLPHGMTHVYGGPDHVAFILALALLAGRMTRILTASLGFTLGHSATLILAALGVLHPDTAQVEAMIGFTVAFVALQAASRRDFRPLGHRGLIAAALLAGAGLSFFGLTRFDPILFLGLALFVFCYPQSGWSDRGSSIGLAGFFGFIHGCGFAGALSGLDLPRTSLVVGLAGFNIGVEIAQVTIVVLALGLGALWGKFSPKAIRPMGADALAASLFGLGLYWFLVRTFA